MNSNRKNTLSQVKKVIVKVGTSTLTDQTGNLNHAKMIDLVKEMALLSQKGYQFILVTSGAVGAGMGELGLSERPTTISYKQAVAAIGQVSLINLYKELFEHYHLKIGQLLLTKSDFSDRSRYLNMRNVCYRLMKDGIIPIINENDTVVDDEIKFGDNDTLSAMVASLIDADALIILSDIDGLYDRNPTNYPDAKLLKTVETIDQTIYDMAGSSQSKFGTGGMATKILAGERAVEAGVAMVIANGQDEHVLTDILAGKEIGTLFAAKDHRMPLKKHWLAYSSDKKGCLLIDKGARDALLQGNSLLPAGVIKVEKPFEKGDVITIVENDEEIAIGIANYSSEETNQIKGAKSQAIESILGHKYADVIVHIDNMLFKKGGQYD